MSLGSFITHIKNVITFNQLPKEKRQVTFYSEGPNYWSYIGSLMQEVLNHSELDVCYVCSSKDDPGLKLEHPRLHKFLIDDASVRNWFFANIDTDIMVMTMPDLHQYQVKKSKYNVHYIYVQHSLVSFHMVYRPGAFDHYNTIFCAGPHHISEMRAIEAQLKVPEKRLFEHGYSRLDSIKYEASIRTEKVSTKKKTHYLLAPSWGETGTIETGIGFQIIDSLLSDNNQVTLRPHPQTIKFYPKMVQAIVDKHKANPNFSYEQGVKGQKSLHDSDVMISDWSGASLDYAFGLEKPVVFVDVARKVNNPAYTAIDIEPFEVAIRNNIGTVISPDNIEAIKSFSPFKLKTKISDEYVFNVGNSDKVGALEIIRMLEEMKS